MDTKRSHIYVFGIILVLVLLTPAYAQRIQKISKFKSVAIPFDLKHEDSVIKKGTYDLEVMRDVTQQVIYLRIYKRGKAVCNLAGEELSYGTWDHTRLFNDPNIPEDAKLKFRRDPENKIVNIIFESGKRARHYPCCKAKFQLGYD